MRPTVIAALLVLAAAPFGCSTERDPRDLLAPGDVGTIVVDATLRVGEPFPAVHLRKTLSPADPYDASAAALGGATLRISDPSGASIEYGWVGGSAYVPTGGSLPNEVLPRTTYRLEAQAPDGRIVRASTTTPDTFHVADWLLLDDPSLAVRRRLATYSDFPGNPDSVYAAESNQVVYQDGLLEARFQRGSAIAFQVGLSSLDLDSPYVIQADFLSEEDRANLTRDSSSPPLEALDGSIRLPWLAIFYEGRYRIRIFSVDQNWYDLARSLPSFGGTNFGFGGNAGDQFDRPLFHVEGGIGLFGSASVQSIGFTVHPKP